MQDSSTREIRRQGKFIELAVRHFLGHVKKEVTMDHRTCPATAEACEVASVLPELPTQFIRRFPLGGSAICVLAS